MARSRLRYAAAGVLLGLALLLAGADCPGGLFPAGGVDELSSARVILLRLVNESGVEARVDLSFFVGENEVRTTQRWLANNGADNTDVVVPTRTDLIRLVAREDGPIEPAAKVGDVLVTAEIEVGPDVLPGDTLTYTLRPPGWVDCNGNAVDDPDDISNGTSYDCNANDIPDECDIASGHSEDCNKNGTPDECETPRNVVVMFAESDRISTTDQDGTAPALLIDLFSEGLGVCGKIAPDPAGGYVYFTAKGASVGDDTLARALLATGSPQNLIVGLDGLEGVAIDMSNMRLYWTAVSGMPAGAYIGAADPDGGNSSTVLGSLSGTVQQVVVDATSDKLFFAQNLSVGTDLIQTANLDGSNVSSILPSLIDPRDIDLFPAADLIVWADHGAGGGVFTARLDGSDIRRIADVPTITGVAIDRYNCRIYWCGLGGGANTGFVERSDFDGGNRQSILSGLDAPVDVAVYTD